MSRAQGLLEVLLQQFLGFISHPDLQINQSINQSINFKQDQLNNVKRNQYTYKTNIVIYSGILFKSWVNIDFLFKLNLKFISFGVDRRFEHTFLAFVHALNFSKC